MSGPFCERIRLFDPQAEYSVLERRLPHWSQAGTLAFITWRTEDSIPASVLRAWLDERNAWLRKNGIDPRRSEWRERLKQLPEQVVTAFRATMSNRWHEHFDDCHGACVLRRTELAGIVSDSLRRFDGVRYELTDFIVMPNHVHLLAAFPDEPAMISQCESWKRFTATKINRAVARQGRFWQQDAFDHLVRSEEQLEHLRRYIAENPRRARLPSGSCPHYSKPLN